MKTGEFRKCAILLILQKALWVTLYVTYLVASIIKLSEFRSKLKADTDADITPS